MLRKKRKLGPPLHIFRLSPRHSPPDSFSYQETHTEPDNVLSLTTRERFGLYFGEALFTESKFELQHRLYQVCHRREFRVEVSRGPADVLAEGAQGLPAAQQAPPQEAPAPGL